MKIIRNISISFLICAASLSIGNLSYAGEKEWYSNYGEELDHVPFTLRNQFQLSVGKSWENASIDERYAFLKEKEEAELERQRIKQERLDRKLKEQKKIEATKKQREKEKADYKKIQEQKERQRVQEKRERARKMEALRKARETEMRTLKQQQRARHKKH